MPTARAMATICERRVPTYRRLEGKWKLNVPGCLVSLFKVYGDNRYISSLL